MSRPLIIGLIIGAIVLVAIVVVVIILWQRRKKAQADALAKAAAAPKPDPAAAIRKAFSDAEQKLAEKVPNPDTRAAIPRVLLMGERRAGKTTLLGATLLNTSLHKADDPSPGNDVALNVWTFDKALVYDPRGDVFLNDEGEAPEPAALDALVSCLKDGRRERPLDAVVVVVPCTDLAPGGAGNDEARKRKATTLHKQLGDIQRKLGVSVPVYVLVSQCDTLPSFQSFGAEVADENKQAILGWSRPDPAGAIAAARQADGLIKDYVGDTMKSLEERLSARQVRRFLGGARVPGAAQQPAGQRLGVTDGLFLFPSELRLIADPLRVYVDEIFVPSVYDEAFELRGIYFCGDSGQRSAAMGAPARSVLFVRKLFEDKIIPETKRSRPSDAALQSRQRLILGLQLGSLLLGVVFGAGLTIQFERLRSNADPIQKCLNDLQTGLEEIKEPAPTLKSLDGEPKPGATQNAERLGKLSKHTITLLTDFSAIHTDRLATPFIPLSYVSLRKGGLDGRVQSAIRDGYEHIVLAAFGEGLTDKLQRFTDEGDRIQRSPELLLSLETSASFVELDAWLQQLLLFERQHAHYNQLATGDARCDEPDHVMAAASGEPPADDVVRRNSDRGLDQVAELAEYLFKHKAGPAFYQESRYYRDVLGEGTRLPCNTIDNDRRQAITRRANALFEEVFAVMLRIYHEDVLRTDLRDLDTGFTALGADASGAKPFTVEQLVLLRDALRRTEVHLAEPLVSWLPNKRPPDQPGLERLFDYVRASQTLGEGVEHELTGRAQRKLYEYPVWVENARTAVTGPLLKHRAEKLTEMALSDDVVVFKKPIEDLLAQGFMRARPEDLEDETFPAAKQYMRWDLDRLREADSLVKEHDAFAQKGEIRQLRAVDPGLTRTVQETLSGLAQRQLVALLRSQVRLAVQEEAALPARSLGESALEERTKEHVENLRAASAPLREIVNAFMRFHQDDARNRLADLIRVHGSLVLDEAYGLLSAEHLYQIGPGPFKAWKAGTTPAYEAFNVPDQAGLVEALNGYRTRAQEIGKAYAEPVVDLLDSAEVAGDKKKQVTSLRQWRGVLRPLAEYDLKRPGNSVTSIEDFIKVDMPQIKLSNCLEKTELADRIVVRDFFLAKKRQILKDLRRQCSIVPEEPTMQQKYTLLQIAFNSRIAGRFPFAPREQALRADDAPPAAVKEFLENAMAFRDTYRSVIANRAALTDHGERAVVQFLDQVRDVSDLLAPMWAQSDSAADGAADLNVDFRANPAHEVGGHEIAEWVLQFPEDKVFYGGPAKQIAHWRMGDPVRLVLRWAKNSPDVPTARQDDNGVVRDRYVTFEGAGPSGTGPWGLFRLIASHVTTVRDAAGQVDPQGTYLGFRIQTKVDASGGFVDPVGPGPNEARVFLRFVLTANKTTLPRYPIFPTEAPSYYLP